MKLTSSPHHFDEKDLVDILHEILQVRNIQITSNKLITGISNFFAESFTEKQPTRFDNGTSGLDKPRFLSLLSGGIDSSVVTTLAVKAVGKENVLPVTLPGRPHDPSVESSKIMREFLGYKGLVSAEGEPYSINIENILQTHRDTMFPLHSQLQVGETYQDQNNEQKIRSGNFASSVRVAYMNDMKRAIRGRILGTINRPEYCQGYGVQHGTPMAYDLGVSTQLYKIELYELARLHNLPVEIINQKPTSGFFEGQTHEGELGATLEEQDAISYLLFHKEMDATQIHKKYNVDRDYVETMVKRFAVSQHKRKTIKAQPFVHLNVNMIM